MSKWVFPLFFIILISSLYLAERRPKILCRITCTTCRKGFIEQDMTKEAVALKGRTAFIKTENGKILRFNDCFGLKKNFFNRRYTRHGNLFWEPIFSNLDDGK